MSFSTGRQNNVILEDILSKVTEIDIAAYYLNISSTPCIINSPLREDKHPSFGIQLYNDHIFYKDFSTKESGSLFMLLEQLWNCTYEDCLYKIYNDLSLFKHTSIENRLVTYKKNNFQPSTDTELKCKIREWEPHDIEYWSSYGISKEWLIYANVYPISYKIIIKNGKTYNFIADKYAYVYVEYKEDKTTLKIYQPYNKEGFKWSNKHDMSVISLWTKVPQQGDKICICSSLKDAGCLWLNTGIPALAVQGEGYSISNTAIQNLKDRYKQIYILFDNDAPGIKDGEKLANLTGFTNLILPKINGAKDISDLYLQLQNKQQFNKLILKLFENENT